MLWHHHLAVNARVFLGGVFFLLMLPPVCPISGLQQATTHEPKYCIINQPCLFTPHPPTPLPPFPAPRAIGLQSNRYDTSVHVRLTFNFVHTHTGYFSLYYDNPQAWSAVRQKKKRKKKLALWLRATMVAFNMGHGYQATTSRPDWCWITDCFIINYGL